MDNVNQTLYIPLYGKAMVSKKGIILSDKKAEQIWHEEGFQLKGKSRSKWLAYFMAMRAAVFDRWLKDKMAGDKNAVVLHIGCGMDSRIERVGADGHLWYDIDFEDVIELRKKHFSADDHYKMLAGDLRDSKWLSEIPENRNAVIVLEGISMYLKAEELQTFMQTAGQHFPNISLLMDCYTERGARATKYKNPVNDVGVTITYGIDNPKMLETGTGFCYVSMHNMTPDEMINELHGAEHFIFKRLFAGKFSKSIYRMYEYQKQPE
ncbi:MAG: class I SAM-dependent methyltransferase [Acutalibacteraceae bacterium]|nr:class I SAM-dependent methyltransferase [Acutalibacteraceae bacterium]